MIRRTSIVCLEVLCGILVVLALLVAGSAWRLSQGPLSIQFLLPYAEDLLQDRDTRYRAELDDLILTWAGWERALDVRALGVRLLEKDGPRPLVRVREISLTLSIHALTEGKITPTSLEIIRPRLRLTRDKSGAIEFAVGEAENLPEAAAGQTAGSTDVLALLLAELSGPARSDSRLRYLNRVSVIGAAMRVEDRKMDINWGARHADITIERAPIGLRAEFDLDIDLRNSRPELHGEAYYDRKAERVDIDLDFTRVNPGLIAERFAALSGLKALAADFNGKTALRIGLDGDIRKVEFQLSSGKGTLTVPDIKVPPYAFRSIVAKGRLNRNPDQLQIADATVDFGNTKVALAGVVTRVGDIAAINVTLGVPTMLANELKKYWPPGTGGGARKWVVTNMRDGRYNDTTASLTARIPLGGKDAGNVIVDSINGRINISGVTIDYLAPMPPIRNAAATATFSDSRFDFAVQSGNIGALKLNDGTVNISGIGSPREVLALTASISGPVREALEIVAHPRLNLLARVGLKTDGAGGVHSTRLQIEFPLLDSLKADEVRVVSTSNISGLALSDIVKGRGVTDGTVALSVTNDGMIAKGTAAYAGTPTEFDWQQDFSGAKDVHTRISAKATVDAALRDIFEVYMRDRIQGPIPINFIYQERRDNTESFSGGLNLTDATVNFPGFDWTKPAGTPATAELAVLMRNGRVLALPQFSIDAGKLKASGKLTFSDTSVETDPVLETLDLKNFVLGTTSFSATARRAADRSLVIDISGGGFDATPFISQDLGGIDAPQLPALTMTGTFGRFWIGQGAPTSNVRMELKRDTTRWERIVVEGALPAGGKAISIKMLPNAEGHDLAIYSADAGSLLKAMDVTDTIRDGIIEIAGKRKGGPDAPWRGTAEMKRFRIANAPNFARLLTLASLTGINDTISGKGIRFERLSFPYVFENEIATVTEARAFGSELGITATGKVDFGKDAIDIKGTIIPAYTINSLIGQIPVIGTILTGEKGGGIFAASYTVSGPVEKPKMAVNPLSALAPGFLRKLLDGGGNSPTEGKTPDQEERLREQKLR